MRKLARYALLIGSIIAARSVSADYYIFAGGAFTFSQGGTTSVPNVTALDTTEADVALEAVGLDTGIVTTACSAEALAEVLSQNPAAGTLVELGTLVDLVASSGAACTGAGSRLSLGLNLRL